MTLGVLNRVYGAAAAYGFTMWGAIFGCLVRVAFDATFKKIAPYHCYDWNFMGVLIVITLVLVPPAAVVFFYGRTRTWITLALGLLAFILSALLTVSSNVIPCGPL
jgi:uncharacterized membrane protein YqaE (UPF0057 family)